MSLLSKISSFILERLFCRLVKKLSRLYHASMRIKKPENFLPRIIMTIVGVLLCSIAVGFFKCARFGVDPFQCLAWGLWGKITPGLSFGTFYIMINVVLLIADLFLDKHYIGIATFINLFLTGYIVDFSEKVISHFAPDPSFALRCIFLGTGVLVICFASSLYMTSDLGVSTYDAIPIIISNRTKWQFRFVRIGTDIICVLIGTICVYLGAKDGQYPGAGTIISAFFMGPLVDFFNRKFARPLLARFSDKK